MVRTSRTPLMQCSLTKGDNLDSTEGLTQLDTLQGKKTKYFLHIKLMFKRTSSYRNNPALRGSQLWSTNLPGQMTLKYITLQSTQPGCATDYQWLSSRDRRGSFQCEQLHSRAPSSHTKKEIVLQATGAESQPSSHLQSKRTPPHSALPPPYLEREQPAEHILG